LEDVGRLYTPAFLGFDLFFSGTSYVGFREILESTSTSFKSRFKQKKAQERMAEVLK